MNPDEVVRRQYFVQFAGKMLIDPHIASEIAARELGNVQPIVENRPQNAISKSVVIFFEVLLEQVSDDIRLIAALNRPHGGVGFCGNSAAPPEPDTGMPLQDRADRNRKST